MLVVTLHGSNCHQCMNKWMNFCSHFGQKRLLNALNLNVNAPLLETIPCWEELHVGKWELCWATNMRKKIPCPYMKKCLSYWLFVAFLPKRQHLSTAAVELWSLCDVILSKKLTMCCSYCCWGLVLKNITVMVSPPDHDLWTFPQKTASLLPVKAQQGPLLTDGDYKIEQKR